MAILINSNFTNQSPTFLDAREQVEDLTALKALNTNIIPDGFETYVKSEDCKYKFLSSNEDTEASGKWRIVISNADTLPLADYQSFMNNLTINAEGYVDGTSNGTTTTS